MPRKSSGGRNAAGTGSIRKKIVKRDGKEYAYWEARYTDGFDPGTGKQIQRSITGKTQKEVAQRLKAITASIDTGTYIPPSKMTVGEWLDIWQKDYLGNAKPHTKKSYQGIIKNHIVPKIGAIRLSELTSIQVQRMLNSIRSIKKTNLGYEVNPKTVKNIHGVLHSALGQAVQCGLIRTNPADHAVLPKRTKADIHVLEDEMLPNFLREIEGHPFQYLYIVDLFTGMRQSELLGLQWPDIDFTEKTITVKRQLQYLGSSHGGYCYATPKNNKSRMIMLPELAVQALERQRERQNEMCRLVGGAWNNPDNLVFTNELGEHIKHDLVYRHLKRIFKRIGAPNLRFHDLRHSYAVLSLRSGCDIKTVQENLGHYAAAFTLDTYAHVTTYMRREGAEKINRFMDKLNEE